MANVADRRPDPMENFFKGISALQQGAEQFTRYNMFNKELDLKKAMADMELSKAQQSTQEVSLRNQVQGQNVLSIGGVATPTEKYLTDIGVDPKTYRPFTKEERQAARNIETATTKHEFKSEEIDQSAKWKIAEQTLKDAGMDERQIKQIGANFAMKNVTPGKAAVGVAASQELSVTSKDIIQPFEDLVNIPGIFGSSKKISAVTLINKMGTKKLNEIDSRIGITPLEFIRKMNAAIKESPKEKDKFLKSLYNMYPETESLLK